MAYVGQISLQGNGEMEKAVVCFAGGWGSIPAYCNIKMIFVSFLSGLGLWKKEPNTIKMATSSISSFFIAKLFVDVE